MNQKIQKEKQNHLIKKEKPFIQISQKIKKQKKKVEFDQNEKRKPRIKNPNYKHSNTRNAYPNWKKAYYVQLYLTTKKAIPSLTYKLFTDEKDLPYGTFSGWMNDQDEILKHNDEKRYIRRARKSKKWLNKNKKAKYEREETQLYFKIIAMRAG